MLLIKFHKHDEFLEDIEKELEHRQKSRFISIISLNMMGEFPIWVLVENFYFWNDFENFCRFSDRYQQDIAKNVGIKSTQVRTYLEVAVVLRNYCAHYNRLYYTSFTKIPGQLPAFMNENSKLKNRLMAQLYAVKTSILIRKNGMKDFYVNCQHSLNAIKQWFICIISDLWRSGKKY